VKTHLCKDKKTVKHKTIKAAAAPPASYFKMQATGPVLPPQTFVEILTPPLEAPVQ
jgi:hypothetical protein